jgi:lysophospholipase L1-like esterase
VIQGGGNDLANGTDSSKIGLHIQELVKCVKQENQSAKVLICGPLIRRTLPVSTVQLTNSLLKRFCSSIRIGFIDPNSLFSLPVVHCLARDGIHLNFTGVSQLHSVILNAIDGFFINLSILESENSQRLLYRVRLK